MQMTERDKILTLVLPATLIIAVYGFWFNASKQRELTGLQKSLSAAVRSAPPEEELLRQRARAAKLQHLLAAQEKDLARKKQYWEEATGSLDPATRPRRLEQLHRVFLRHGLHLVGDAPAEGGNLGSDARISPALQAFSRALTEASHRTPVLWSIRVDGGYPELLAALKELAEGQPLGMPVGLSMKTGGIGSPVQKWVLLMWI
jgi:hypothetical protein